MHGKHARRVSKTQHEVAFCIKTHKGREAHGAVPSKFPSSARRRGGTASIQQNPAKKAGKPLPVTSLLPWEGMLSGREPLWGFAERKLRAPLLQSGAACRDPAGRISSVQEQPCEAPRRTRAMRGPQQLGARLTSGPAAPAGLSTDSSPPGGAGEKCPPRGHLFKSAFLCHSGFQLVCVSVLWLLCFRLLGKSMEMTALF